MSKSARRSDRQTALARVFDTPHLARAVPRLQPELLHRVIQRWGLEDCRELVALATPAQLARVFDLDLWRAAEPGLDEQFDAGRFGMWLEVLVDAGVAVAAEKLAAMDAALVGTALAQHVRVFERVAVTPYKTTDGDTLSPMPGLDEGFSCDVGGYRIVAARADAWDAIVSVLAELDAEHPRAFDRMMRECLALSSAAPEPDGFHDLLTDHDQGMFDLTFDREQRRETHGYVTPAQARAFLQASREIRLESGSQPPVDPIVRAAFRALAHPIDEAPAPNDAGAATAAAEKVSGGSAAEERAAEQNGEEATAADAAAAIVDVLLEAGLFEPPRALLAGPQDPAPRLDRIRAHMHVLREENPVAYAERNAELAYLANAIVSGCSIQARPFTPQEAWDAAVAACNLGLENWPPHWPSAADLVSLFQVGWTILHRDVGMHAAERLVDVLADLRGDEDHVLQADLDALRVAMTRAWRDGAPWRARDALDVIATLDMPAWATLVALLDECPVQHAALAAARAPNTHAVGANAFEFISENRQIAAVRNFLRSLPAILRG